MREFKTPSIVHATKKRTINLFPLLSHGGLASFTTDLSLPLEFSGLVSLGFAGMILKRLDINLSFLFLFLGVEVGLLVLGFHFMHFPSKALKRGRFAAKTDVFYSNRKNNR